MKLLLLSVTLFAHPVFAQPQISAPQQGMMLDRAGALRPVTGMAQTFTAGDPIQTGIISAACGKSLCVTRSADSNPTGTALISIEGNSALLYFPSTRQFARLHGGQLTMLNWSVDGEVLALRGEHIVVKRDTHVRLMTPAGAVLASLPDETNTALLLHGLTIYATQDALVLSRPDGSGIRFYISGITSLTQIGERYVQVATPDSTYALRIDAGNEQIALLPEVRP